MGILDQLGFQGPIASWINSNRNLLTGFGASVDPTQRTLAGALQPAWAGATQGRQIDTQAGLLAAQEAERQAAAQQSANQQTNLLSLLQQNAPDLVPWVNAGRENEAFAEYARRQQPAGAMEPPQIETIFDEATGREQQVQWNGTEWVPIGGVEAPGQPLVTVNNGSEVGTIPAGYELVTDPVTGNRSMRPIQGGPVAAELAQAGDREAAGRQAANDRAATVVAAIDQALDQSNFFTTGPVGSAGRGIGATPNVELENTVNTVKAQLGFNELTQMRQSAPSGASGLGQVTERELNFLQSVVTSLDVRQGEEQLDKNLRLVRTLLIRQQLYRELDAAGIPLEDPRAQELLSQVPLPEITGMPTMSAPGGDLYERYGLERP